ncbi:hypothetical protein Har1131_18430 [Haloarcula sp. CBA1131]|nr:hypothetical protein Har1131_18430 [Haloarcula sp. CBA1131]
MIRPVVLQVTAFLEVLPSWLPTVAICTGVYMMLVGMSNHYLESYVGHVPQYTSVLGSIIVISLSTSIAGATYVSVIKQEMVLLFVFFAFVSGRMIQGAITARIIQKVYGFFFGLSGEDSSDSLGGTLKDSASKVWWFVWSKIKDRILIITVSMIIVSQTTLSIFAVYAFGDGQLIRAIRRFWIGFFFLTVAGITFDFRYFAHRISWTAALGLVIATAGSFLYSPAGFSNLTSVLGPYLENPVPDWMRLPLGAFGFLAGFVFWAIFYRKHG